MPLNAKQTRFAYAFGGYSRREANSAGFYRRGARRPQLAADLPARVPAGDPADWSSTVSGTAGVRGALNAWAWDASAGYGHNSFAFTIGNTLNVSLGPTVPPNKTVVRRRHAAARTGHRQCRRQPAVQGRPDGRAAQRRLRRRGAARAVPDFTPASPTPTGTAASPNRAGGIAAIGAQVFPGFRPSNAVNESRESVAAYVDVEGDFLKWLRLGFAGRTEHYSDFGGTVQGKLTARVQVDPRFVVRGAVSTGFRAPSLGQSFFSSSATNFLNVAGQGLVPFESLTLPVTSPAAQVLGAQTLKPENSVHVSGGVVITPLPGLDVTIDYYHIAIDDRIVLSGNFTGPRITTLLAPFGANSARFFTNAINTRTNGVDLSAGYRIALADAGDVRLHASYNNTRTKIVGAVTTPPQLEGFDQVLFDRIERRRIECYQPRDNFRAGADWRRSRWGANTNVARYGEFCTATATPADDQTYQPKWLTDAEISYRVAKTLTLAAGAQNIFNVFPDRNTTVNSFNGIQTFPSQSPFGMNGRAVYGRLAWKL